MTKRKQERKIDGRTGPAKRRRTLIAAYESQMGDALSPATRSLIARALRSRSVLRRLRPIRSPASRSTAKSTRAWRARSRVYSIGSA
jgi:hypothetical protein